MTTANENGFTLQNKEKICEDCAVAKAKQMNISKESSTEAGRAGEQLFIDISTMQKPSLGGNKHWALVLDEYTKYKWPILMKNKSELSQKVIQLLFQLQKEGRI